MSYTTAIMTNTPQLLAYSLIGKHRIKASEVEGKVHNVRLVDEILRRHGYKKIFSGTGAKSKGWAISERFTNHNEYLA